MKEKTVLYIGLTLIASAAFNMYCLLYIIRKEQEPKVSFPEEYNLVTEQDSLKAIYKNDTLFIEFNNAVNQRVK